MPPTANEPDSWEMSPSQINQPDEKASKILIVGRRNAPSLLLVPVQPPFDVAP